MIWDARVWSFFMWFIAAALFLCGFCTPYSMPGNNEKIPVAFGGSVDPREDNYIGLWGKVPEDIGATMMAVRGLCCVTAVMFFCSGIMFILLFKKDSTICQILSCTFNILAGVFAIIAVVIYRVASNQLGEGFYFIAAAGGLSIICGITMVLIPWMEYRPPQWKLELVEANMPESIPLKDVAKTQAMDDNANA